MAITATVGGSSSNSYVTLGYADEYFDNSLEGVDWQAYGEREQEQALVSATRAIDELITLRGLDGIQYYDKASATPQALLFPRSVDLNAAGAIEIPDDIETATCLLAKHLLDERHSTQMHDIERARDLGIRTTTASGVFVSLGVGTAAFNTWPRVVRSLVSRFWRRAGKTTVERTQPQWRDWGDDNVIAV